MKNIYTIELNLDDDYASSCAYHVAGLMETINQNIKHAEDGRDTQRWVLVGLATSHAEALDKCAKLQELLCKRNGKRPLSLIDI